MKVEQAKAQMPTFTDGLFLHHYHCPFDGYIDRIPYNDGKSGKSAKLTDYRK